MSDATLAQDTSIPDHSVGMTNGGTFSLSNFRNRNIVLFFYPKDGTPGCTTESINFRDLYDQFQAANTEVFGVSRDSLRSHEAFKAKLGMPFELISDVDEVLCNLFSVIKNRNMYGKQVRGIERSTFVIDVGGRLVKEWRGLKVAGHVDDVLAYVRTLPGTESRL